MSTLGTYSFSLIERILHTKIHGRLSNLNSVDTNTERDLINSAVRVALTDIDFKGFIRESVLTPNLADSQWEYALPTDADVLIDLRPQATDSRDEFETYSYIPPEEFDRRKKVERGIYTVTSNDLTRRLRISSDVRNTSLNVSSLDDTAAGGGDWTTFDSTSVNDSDVKADASDFIEGAGAIRFQTDTTDTTDSVVGIQNVGLTAFDISSYLARGSAFVNAKLTVADTGIHQISLRIGTDSNNYYRISDSNQNDCSAFIAGWNKIRWDFQNKTTVGTPTDTATKYAALYWSRDTTTTALLHLNDTDWGFDGLQLELGKYYDISYYSRNVWQAEADTTYATLENSTNDSQTLMVHNDELEVIMAKAAELASQYLRDPEDAKYFAGEYTRLKQAYLMKNPSQESILTTSRYNFINSYDSAFNKDS